MLRAVARRTGQALEAVDYATMSLSGSPPYTWFLGLERGPPRERQWLAAADGGDLHRSGEVAPSQKARDERRRRRLEARQRRIQKLFERRSACLRRATSAEQVTRCIERYAP